MAVGGRPNAGALHLLASGVRGWLAFALVTAGLANDIAAATPIHAAAEATAVSNHVFDERGRRFDFAHAPERVISLLPSLTETVCELGACTRLVGVDRSSNHPASVMRLPRVGGIEDANIERIVALRPDVVLAPSSARIVQRLEQLGITVLTFEPKHQMQARETFMQLARMLHVTDAAVRWQAIEQRLLAVAASVPTAARGWRTYVEVAPGPYAAGEASFMGELLTMLGLRNVVPRSLGPFPKLTPEFVVSADPDFIVVTSATRDELRARPGWRDMMAMRRGRVCVLRGADGDAFSRPGPRLPQAAQAIVACLNVASSDADATRVHGR